MNKMCSILCIVFGILATVLTVPITLFLDKIVSIQINIVIMCSMAVLGMFLTAEGLAEIINSAIDERLYGTLGD